MSFLEIAIVGQGCVLPSAFSPQDLWQLVYNGKVALSPINSNRWRINLNNVLRKYENWEPSTTYGDVGGYIEGFDSDLRDGVDSDPVFHWTNAAISQALSSVNTTKNDLLDNCGLILGNLSYPSETLSKCYEELMLGKNDSELGDQLFSRFMSGGSALWAAKKYGLGKLALALDAACASSLYAIKLACDELESGRADMMLAGGVCASDTLFISAGFSALRAFSQSGQSRPFCANADGLVPGEGAAIVALKRLKDAVSDGDKILGVIRAVGLSNDGKSQGFLIPDKSGQMRCMVQAFSQSGFEPDDIDYIECHATGTNIGDRTELASLSEIFSKKSTVHLGALKANIGHSITASGAAGLIKVLQAMQRETIPRLTGDYDLLPEIADYGFLAPREHKVWSANKSRKACINSFGFGGNNAQLIVESWPLQAAHQGNKRVKSTSALPRKKVAIVAVDIRTDSIPDGGEFFNALTDSGNLKKTNLLDNVTLDLRNTPFPPSNLEHVLGQQLLIQVMTADLLRKHPELKLDPKKTSVYIGISVDSEICRYGFRARLQDLLAKQGKQISKQWLADAENAIIAPLEASDLLGNMPNIPANRLNVQYNFQGPSFTVSSEELSGNHAWHIASEAIARGDIDSAVVGSVMLSQDQIHRSAVAKYITKLPISKAGVVLLLKNLDEAKKAGDKILAVIDEGSKQFNTSLFGDLKNSPIIKKFGYTHTAHGLLHIAFGCMLAAKKAEYRDGKILPNLVHQKDYRVFVSADSFLAKEQANLLAYPSWQQNVLYAPTYDCCTLAFSASSRAELISRIKEGKTCKSADQSQNFRLLISTRKDKVADILRRILSELQAGKKPELKDVYYGEQLLSGEIAFVYTGAASAYPNMGKTLLLDCPNLLPTLKKNQKNIKKYCEWIYHDKLEQASLPFFQLAGSSFLCQLHTQISLALLKRYPDAAIGLSSGETNSMFALGVWQDIDGLFLDIEKSGLYKNYLANEFLTIKKFWQLAENDIVCWDNWRILAPVDEIKAVVSRYSKVYLTIINHANDCMIGGEREACQAVINHFGQTNVHRVPHDLAIHCSAVMPFKKAWQEIHTRPTKSVTGIRFYSNYLNKHYVPTQDLVAKALTGQAITMIDFPRIINKAWDDGVRIFIEHGPRDSLTKNIAHILSDRPHLTVALDANRGGVEHIISCAAKLWCAGIDVDLQQLPGFSVDTKEFLLESIPIWRQFSLSMPEIILPLMEKQTSTSFTQQTLVEQKSARLVSNIQPSVPLTNTIAMASVNSAAHCATASSLSLQLNDVQQRYYQVIKTYHQHQLHQYTHMQALLLNRVATSTKIKNGTADPSQINNAIYPGPKFNRQQLEILASGKISSIFGALFEQQDHYLIQCRMPEPPLLLCDRVLGIDGEPGSMSLGRIWTQTDICEDSWFVYQGRIPAGIMTEAGQADLLLISWLGIDFLNKGERAYRLLGCELTYYDGLPKVGDTLEYKIEIDRHIEQSGLRLFLFHCDCYVDGKVRLSVRRGQAGFFTKEELANGEGIFWDPKKASSIQSPKMDALDQSKMTKKNSFSVSEVTAYTLGKMSDCFGQTHVLATTHTRTPKSQAGEQNFIDEVLVFEPYGGPVKRGYLKARTQVNENAWYFKGHFKNDPCMPGNLMAEAGMQALSFYITALGLTLDKDGWQFQPLSGKSFHYSCRGQVLPSSKEIIYELFIEDVCYENKLPTIFANILISVDGVKAFLGTGVALQLAPGWPISDKFDLLRKIDEIDKAYEKPIASYDGFKFNYYSLINCAWGKCSDGFGPKCYYYDSGLHRSPRLPGDPYHFITRITYLEAKSGEVAKNSFIVSEYQIPNDAWYFSENVRPVMPNAVLMEAALQPSGWLATFTLDNNIKEKSELLFRNLDGKGIQFRELTPKDKVLTIETLLKNSSKFGETIITSFAIVVRSGQDLIYTLESTFGFFPPEVFEKQVGLPCTEEEKANITKSENCLWDLTSRQGAFFDNGLCALPKTKLIMLDRITYFDAKGGRAQLGYIRAERDVCVSDWYFKAHFFQDPVQPGSLGVEAMLQLLQTYLIHTGKCQGFENPVFEPIAMGAEIEWHYRGQVVPDNDLILLDAEILEETIQPGKVTVMAIARLWLNGIKIYQAPKIAVTAREKK